MSRIRLFAVLGLLGLLVAACSAESRRPQPVANPTGGTVSVAGGLEQRVDALYRAEAAEDWRAWYSLTAQAKTGGSTYEEFRKQTGRERSFRVVDFKIAEVRSGRLKDDVRRATGATAMKLVRMDVTVERPDGKQEKPPDQTDQWLLIDGRWYWGWRGWSSD